MAGGYGIGALAIGGWHDFSPVTHTRKNHGYFLSSKIDHKKWLIPPILGASSKITSENTGYWVQTTSKFAPGSQIASENIGYFFATGPFRRNSQ